jgi:iron complex transport system ATP-binding protein
MAITPPFSGCLAPEYLRAKLLEVHQLKIGFKDKIIASGINFQIQPSDVLTIIGPNGSGKSTLLRTLVGLQKPLSGEVKVNRESVLRQSSRQKAAQISWVPQNEAVEFAWSVREYVSLGRLAWRAGLFETEEDRKYVSEALEAVGISDKENNSIHELSGGEFQRVRIARGLAQMTDFVVLDEPTAHLDVAYQSQILSIIADLQKIKKTIVLSLHDLNQALFLSSKALLMYEGKAHFFEHIELALEGQILETAFEQSFDRSTLPGGQKRIFPTYRTTD